MVAFGRRPYTTKFRPFVNSDQQVDLVWYPAEPDAPVLGYPSKIQQLDNVSFPWLAQGVGEVFGTPRPFNHRQVIPFQQFDHVCGDREDFEFGGLRDDSLPPVEYNRNDIPICCNPAFVGQGGARASGTAQVTVTPGCANHYSCTNSYIPGPPVLSVTNPCIEWVYVNGGDNVSLEAPGIVLPDWTLFITHFGTDVFTADASWNGRGTRVFHSIFTSQTATVVFID